MISLRKLATLPEGNRMRKTVSLIADFERTLVSGDEVDRGYLKDLLAAVAADELWPEALRTRAGVMVSTDEVAAGGGIRSLNGLKHQMLEVLGRTWADWDMEMPGDDNKPAGGCLMPVRVYLDGIRSPFNIGSVMRTSLAFGMERIWCSPEGASPDHQRARRSSMGASGRINWEIRDFTDLNKNETGTVFALELGGTPLSDFQFPESGTVIIGSEEFGVRPALLQRAEEDGGIVSIPLPGPKASLNVGVAFGILIRQWLESLDQRRRLRSISG